MPHRNSCTDLAAEVRRLRRLLRSGVRAVVVEGRHTKCRAVELEWRDDEDPPFEVHARVLVIAEPKHRKPR